MFRYRLIYTLILLATFIFYIAYSPWFSWYLLVFVFLLIPLDLIISFPGMRAKNITLCAPKVVEQFSDANITFTTISNDIESSGKVSGYYPVKFLYARLHVKENDFPMYCNVRCPAFINHYNEVAINTSLAGLTVFTVKKLSAVSLLGLFSKKILSSEKVSVLILPAAQKPANSVVLPRSIFLKPKPGGGFSEDHDIRPYQPGDPVRSIHWKLSAKYDSLIIREPLIPPKMSRLVHVSVWKNAMERNSILAHLRWVSNYLLNKGLPFHIKYGDRQLLAEINSEDDLVDFLRHALNNDLDDEMGYCPRITRFSWVFKVES